MKELQAATDLRFRLEMLAVSLTLRLSYRMCVTRKLVNLLLVTGSVFLCRCQFSYFMRHVCYLLVATAK